MTETSKRKKQSRYNYKWAKVLGWEIEDIKKRVDEIEKKLSCLKQTVSLISKKMESNNEGEVNAKGKREEE